MHNFFVVLQYLPFLLPTDRRLYPPKNILNQITYISTQEYALSASPHPGSNTGVVIASTPDWDRDETVRVVCTSDTHNSLRCKRRDKGPGEWKEVLLFKKIREPEADLN